MQEWSRLLSKRGAHLSAGVRRRVNTLSSNSLSLADAFLAAWLTRTSIVFKVCYLAALLASLCAVVAQAMVALVPLPAYTATQLDIPLTRAAYAIDQPWSADVALAPGNYYFTQIGKLGTYLAYLEQVAGIRVSDAMPPGYIVPRLNNTNIAGSPGFQYATDAMRVHCNCTWVAPLLPNATNASYIPIGLESFGIIGVQTGPHGIASECCAIWLAFFADLVGCSVRAGVEYDVCEFYGGDIWAFRVDAVVRVMLIFWFLL